VSLQTTIAPSAKPAQIPRRRRSLTSLLLIAGLLAVAAFLSSLMFKLRPVPSKVEPEVSIVAVEALTVALVDHPVQVPSQGAFQPLTETKMAAEVAGRLITVAPALEAGGQFAEGEVMLEIDPTNYAAAVAQAESALAEAQLALINEQARADQAKRDWGRLAPKENPNELVQRLPQLASAKARVRAAEAGLDKARHDFELTRVRAPYPCMVKTKKADLGDFVTLGSPLAEVWRSDIFEVRLPVTLDQLSLIDLAAQPEVKLTVAGPGPPLEWTARLARSEGVVDTVMRSLYLVARLENPQPPPTPGLFARAAIRGRTLTNVAPVPRKALLDASRLVVIDAKDTLHVRTVRVAWNEAEQVFVSEGLKDGERVCLTALAAVVDGMPVKVIGTGTAPPARAAPLKQDT
jgi:membrane fusion protein, multidrug efflux system